MKMADGRKTRGKLGQKNEKAKLDKEWNQVPIITLQTIVIQGII